MDVCRGKLFGALNAVKLLFKNKKENLVQRIKM